MKNIELLFFQIQIDVTMFKTIAFLIFSAISQATILAQVKSIDFKKKCRIFHSASIKTNIESTGLKEYLPHRISLQTINFNKLKFNDDIGTHLMNKKAVIKGQIDLNSDYSLGLINKYQFRYDLNQKSRMPIASLSDSQFN